MPAIARVTLVPSTLSSMVYAGWLSLISNGMLSVRMICFISNINNRRQICAKRLQDGSHFFTFAQIVLSH